MEFLMRTKAFLIALAASTSLLGSPNLASAQTLINGQQASAHGEAINRCRAEEHPSGSLDDHHERLERYACVHRVLRDAGN
jgi:hypothetical protein